VKQIYEQKTVAKVFNLYGPSEDTTYSTYVCLKKAETGSVGIRTAGSEHEGICGR